MNSVTYLNPKKSLNTFQNCIHKFIDIETMKYGENKVCVFVARGS